MTTTRELVSCALAQSTLPASVNYFANLAELDSVGSAHDQHERVR
jgi:hypothetical protein